MSINVESDLKEILNKLDLKLDNLQIRPPAKVRSRDIQ
jgi:hypothetical protein